jgi:recombinational DNA repair protein RecR
MPVGGGLDTADSLTLHRAFQHRRTLDSAQPHPA